MIFTTQIPSCKISSSTMRNGVSSKNSPRNHRTGSHRSLASNRFHTHFNDPHFGPDCFLTGSPGIEPALGPGNPTLFGVFFEEMLRKCWEAMGKESMFWSLAIQQCIYLVYFGGVSSSHEVKSVHIFSWLGPLLPCHHMVKGGLGGEDDGKCIRIEGGRAKRRFF